MADAAPRKIILDRIAYVIYQYSDWEKELEFLYDFGFTEAKRVSDEKIYFRGYGTEPWVLLAIKADKAEFGGVGFVVESEDDLHYAAKVLPNASKVQDLEDAPGGGKRVIFNDPVDGFPFHLVYGRQSSPMIDIPLPKKPVNYPTEKNRGVNQFQRFEKRPAPVHKLGHFGVCTTNYAKAFEFYKKHFNFIPSDVQFDDSGTDHAVFWRLDRGKERVDHHSFFFYEGPKFHPHHASFETHDFDTQVLGHDWLREKGYRNCWGVGRHILGSQIFDYWFDPHNFIMEHYSDGDLVDDTEPPHRSKSGPGTLHVWGPDTPSDFLV